MYSKEWTNDDFVSSYTSGAQSVYFGASGKRILLFCKKKTGQIKPT